MHVRDCPWLALYSRPTAEADTLQMSEEVAKSSTNVPRAMIYATMVNGTAGLAMLIAVLFSAGNLNDVAQSSATYPIIGLLSTSLNSVGAATALMSINILMNACAATSFLASSSRLNWAFARERALPGWQWLVQVRDQFDFQNL